VAREGRAWTVVAIQLAAAQQIAGFWLSRIGVQEGRGASAAQEKHGQDATHTHTHTHTHPFNGPFPGLPR